MTDKHARWLGAYALAALTEMSAGITGSPLLAGIAKSLLIPFLAIWFFYETKRVQHPLRGWYLFALLFSTLGDVLLIFAKGPEGTLWFISGLAAFLCTHLCLIAIFNKITPYTGGFLREKPVFILAYVAYVGLFLGLLWTRVPEAMRLPIGAYALTIAFMSLGVLNLRHRIPEDAFLMLLYGSFLFVFSDSMIAVSRFVYAFEGAGIVIMSTYIAAQWLIASGLAIVLREKFGK